MLLGPAHPLAAGGDHFSASYDKTSREWLSSWPFHSLCPDRMASVVANGFLAAAIVTATSPLPEGKPAVNGANTNVPSSDAMPELIKPNVAELIPELRSVLRPAFSSVHCDLATCPSLNQAPFNLPVQGPGPNFTFISV
uniref:Secreted protein n=1 Tax=Globodera pallida TaxID=36090 RepID=A0A183CMN1_GLOPA